MNKINPDLIRKISEYLDIEDIKEFKFISKKNYKNIIFNLQFIKSLITFNKFITIPSVIAYNIGREYLKNKDIKNCVKVIPYCHIPLPLSIFCTLGLEEGRILIDTLKSYPNLIDYDQLIEDDVVSPYSKIDTTNYFIGNFIYYLIAKWTFGVNSDIFMHCIKEGSKKGYSYLFNSCYFSPISPDEEECYDLMIDFFRQNDYLF